MGGCRCSFRNCTLRTDGKTHMFHYPVFDKVRCHQWLTNARKLEFLNLKVSQLKNRVVCQHHFKDENFMNFKKDKLTFDAVPTENGPYCDSSQFDDIKTESEDTKVLSISLDDIEDEYLTVIDKKANFSVKYGDFLTNCDLMDLDTLNQINDDTQIPFQNICVFDSHVPKEQVPCSRPVRSNTKFVNKGNSNNTILKDNTNRKNTIIENNVTIDYNNTPKNIHQNTEDHNLVNVYHGPIEFDQTKGNNNKQMPAEPQRLEMLVGFVETNSNQNQHNLDQSINCKPLEESKSLNENNNRSLLKEFKKIRIISEKKQILEPVPLIGKLEPVSPNRILTLPIQKTFKNPKPTEFTTDASNTTKVINNTTKETPDEVIDPFKDNLVAEKSIIETNEISDSTATANSRNNYVPPQKPQAIKKNMLSNKCRNEVSPDFSLLKNKIPPERVAAIAEKRKFNMKLRDIIEDCLDKLDEQDKTDYDKRKPSLKSRAMQTKVQQVGSYLAKEPELPDVQDYTIPYLEARLKKMENNLLNKIDENTNKIEALKQTVAPTHNKKSVHTQTLVSEDVHKKQLYQQLSQYLSQEANSLIYEELFINKFTQPKSPSSKRRKRR